MSAKNTVSLEAIEPLISQLWGIRWLQAEKQVDFYMRIPQLTCGQLEIEEPLKFFEVGVAEMATISSKGILAQIDFLNSNVAFCHHFFEHFRHEIQEFESMKVRLKTDDLDLLRSAYLDENSYPADHPARFFNPTWKEYLE